MATAARIAILGIAAGLTITLSAIVAQAQVYQSIMTRSVGSDGFSAPQADNSPSGPIRTLDVAIDDGSSNRPGLLTEGSTAAAQPANPEVLPNVLSPIGPIVAGPAQPEVGVAQPGMYPIGVATPPGPLSPDPSMDSGQPAPHHPIRDGFRRLFGPEPNGNWLNEPVHFDSFLGFLDDRTAENTGVLGGFRLGWDYDTYWGVETRLGFTSLQQDTGPVVIWDESLLYYPWGDSRVRPYLTLGLGISEFRIVDADDLHSRQNLVDMPFGFGFKYRLHEWLVLRFDVLDNLAFGSGRLGTMNNFSFTTGFEYRFGGEHYNYWPWNPAPAR
jgi:hypothetical protein